VNILVTGGSGLLGTHLIKLINKDYNILYPTSSELNILNIQQLNNYFNINKINLVIHCAAYTDVKNAQHDYIKCMNINVVGTCNLVSLCSSMNIKIIYISTDQVFDGNKGDYRIDDFINPINKYAKSKAAGELVVKMYENSLVIRTSFFANDFPYDIAFYDQYTTKDYIDIMAPKILNLCLSNKTGIVHCASLKKTLYELAKQKKPNIKKISRKDFHFSTPFDTSLIEKED
jgi:dTDP-4-dehydrorhamnose reductase